MFREIDLCFGKLLCALGNWFVFWEIDMCLSLKWATVKIEHMAKFNTKSISNRGAFCNSSLAPKKKCIKRIWNLYKYINSLFLGHRVQNVSENSAKTSLPWLHFKTDHECEEWKSVERTCALLLWGTQRLIYYLEGRFMLLISYFRVAPSFCFKARVSDKQLMSN